MARVMQVPVLSPWISYALHVVYLIPTLQLLFQIWFFALDLDTVQNNATLLLALRTIS
jgi:hypothetical protein